MNVAITAWGERVSPVFDASRSLLIAKIRHAEIVETKTRLYPVGNFSRFLHLLEQQKVQVLICGALCEGPVRQLNGRGIEVIPFITGETQQILALFAQGRELVEFAMPGCGSSRCCRTRRGGQQGEGGKQRQKRATSCRTKQSSKR